MEYIERLEKSLSELENNSGKLASLPELVKSIKELISLYQEAGETFNQSGKGLKEIESSLKNRLEELEKAIKKEQEHKDELLNTIRSALTANNKEQLDAVNSVTTVVGNKITIAESNMIAKSTEIDNGVKRVEAKTIENSTKIDSSITGIANVGEKVCTYGDATTKDLGEMKNMIPIIKRTQIISIIAAVLALAACIISVVL